MGTVGGILLNSGMAWYMLVIWTIEDFTIR